MWCWAMCDITTDLGLGMDMSGVEMEMENGNGIGNGKENGFGSYWESWMEAPLL